MPRREAKGEGKAAQLIRNLQTKKPKTFEKKNNKRKGKKKKAAKKVLVYFLGGGLQG